MRTSFKQIADENTASSRLLLGDVFDGIWKITHACTAVIDRCLMDEVVSKDPKLSHLLVMLRNSISDCCCCLDALERGHDRTVSNNIRMILEDFCSVVQGHQDDSTYNKMLSGKHQASSSISFVKKNCSLEDINILYGALSKISHHQMRGLVARQFINRDGLLSIIKPFNPHKLRIQITPLILLVGLVGIIGRFAEEICTPHLSGICFYDKCKNPIKNHTINLMINLIIHILKHMLTANNVSDISLLSNDPIFKRLREYKTTCLEPENNLIGLKEIINIAASAVPKKMIKTIITANTQSGNSNLCGRRWYLMNQRCVNHC